MGCFKYKLHPFSVCLPPLSFHSASQVSSDTARILKRVGGYHLEDRGPVHVKGKDPMLTFWLLGKDGFFKPLPSIAEAAGSETQDLR